MKSVCSKDKMYQEGVIFSTMIDLDYKGGGAKGLVEDLVIQ